MTAAIIAAAAAVVIVAGIILWLAIRALDAEKRAGEARVSEQDKVGKLAIAETNLASEKLRADRQEQRANALDDELETVASDGDSAGARARVLHRLTRETGGTSDSASGTSPAAVPDSKPDPKVASIDDTALAKPGD